MLLFAVGIAWFALPLIVWVALLVVGRRLHPVLIGFLCLASMIAGVLILVAYVRMLDAHLLAEIDKYEPGSIEAERASEAWASDTDRSFTLLLSPVLTGIWYTLVYFFLFAAQWIVSLAFPAKKAAAPPRVAVGARPPRTDDGNPYQPPSNDPSS